VQEHPDYVPSLLNLGHSYLESGNYTAALDYYRRVVQLDPHIFEALYNSALAYRMLNDKDNEKQALRQYLDSCRTGKWAYRAVDRLHQLEDFTFRSYRIGAYRLVLNVADLLQADPIIRQREAELLARAVSRTDRQELHIVVYNKEKKDLARQTAFELRDQLLGRLGPEHDSLIKASWFDAAETRSSESGENLQLSPSVLLFSSPITEQNRRDSI
jgi:tetratricopeptide (TPR) repeat protein